MKVKTTVRIESIKKLVNLTLDKTELYLTLQLGGSITAPLSENPLTPPRKKQRR